MLDPFPFDGGIMFLKTKELLVLSRLGQNEASNDSLVWRLDTGISILPQRQGLKLMGRNTAEVLDSHLVFPWQERLKQLLKAVSRHCRHDLPC
jgi:hypothetical protein